jgi:hypothetical protein
MRRLWTMLTVLVVAGVGGGCCHTSGKCDCDWKHDPCDYYTPYYTTGHDDSSPYYTHMQLHSSYHELPFLAPAPPPPKPEN